MSELRKKQREKREGAILEAAKKLIGEKGYRETSVEEIAAAAEVGPATVYNYFDSKAGLLLSMVAREADLLLASGEKVLREPPAGAEDAIYALIQTYFEVYLRRFSKRLMREIMVVFMLEPSTVREKMMGLDYLMIGQIVKMLDLCKQRGQLRDDLETTEVAMTVYSLVITLSIAHIVEEDAVLKSFFGMVRRQIAMLFEGIAPRPAT